jgi:hypothetical protein
MKSQIITAHRVVQSIRWIRGQKVLLDSDLAALYGVPTKVLNQAVKRNRKRFPDDFMFQLTRAETSSSLNWSQFVTSSRKHRGKTYRLYAFTEQGVREKTARYRARNGR